MKATPEEPNSAKDAKSEIGKKPGVRGRSAQSSKAPVKFDCSTEPSTFELATLAAAVLKVTPNQRIALEMQEAVLEAMELWRAARDLTLGEKQIKALLAGIFTLTPEEWAAQIRDYCGSRPRLTKLVYGGAPESPHYTLDGYLLRKLFPVKGYSTGKRIQKLDSLLEYADKYRLHLIDFERSLIHSNKNSNYNSRPASAYNPPEILQELLGLKRIKALSITRGTLNVAAVRDLVEISWAKKRNRKSVSNWRDLI